ncbi:MAG: PspC domain-containing protein [Dehalococcoidia bacterium]
MTTPTDSPNDPPPRPPLDGDIPAEDAPALAASTDTAAPAAPVAPPPPPSGRRRLYRSRTDEWLGGVAGGLADYFDTDPTLVRIALVVLAFVTSGIGVLAYLVAWVIIPEEPRGAGTTAETGAAAAPRPRGQPLGGIVWGLVLVVAGAIFLLAQLDLDVDVPAWEVGLSALLILTGLLMAFEARRGLHGGLLTLAIVLTVLLGVSRAADLDLAVNGAFGDQTVRPATVQDLDDSYGHVFGSLTLDLRGLDAPDGTTEVSVSVVFGSTEVLLPQGVPARISANTLFGNVEGPDFERGGIAAQNDFTTPGYEDATRRLHINLNSVFGSGSVR